MSSAMNGARTLHLLLTRDYSVSRLGPVTSVLGKHELT